MDSTLEDAALTVTGRRQALALRDALAGGEDDGAAPAPPAVFVSTLQRALQTAVLAFGGAEVPVEGDAAAAEVPPPPEAASPPRFAALEELREQAGVHHCDRRRPLSAARAQFPGVDFGGVASDGDALWQETREPKAATAARALAALRVLARAPEAALGVVTHSSFLLTCFRVVLDLSASPGLGAWFETAERRVVVLDVSGLVGGGE